MSVSDDYIQYVHDILQAFAPLKTKRMFGGAGVYSGEWFFAIIADDELYFKVDEGNRQDYLDRGLKPFQFTAKSGKTSIMSYYPIPADVLDDEPLLAEWVQKALDAARRGKKKR
jgi:DNA transformation protein